MKVQLFVRDADEVNGHFLGHADHTEIRDVFDTIKEHGISLGDLTQDEVDWNESGIQFIDRKSECVAEICLVCREHSV